MMAVLFCLRIMMELYTMHASPKLISVEKDFRDNGV
jgi:hypothetical protein